MITTTEREIIMRTRAYAIVRCSLDDCWPLQTLTTTCDSGDARVIAWKYKRDPRYAREHIAIFRIDEKGNRLGLL